MKGLLLGICRDLYLVLLALFLLEQIPGQDFLHDATRFAVVTSTVGVVVVWLLRQCFSSGGSSGIHLPQRLKKTAGAKTERLEWAHSEMQGWRPAMEDATCAIAKLPAPLLGQALFGVFDGHGGSQVSEMAASQFPKVLTACAAELADAEHTQGAKLSEHVTAKSLHDAMLEMDRHLREVGAKLATERAMSSGTKLSGIATSLENFGRMASNAFQYVGSTATVLLVDTGEGSSGSSSSSTNGGALHRPWRLAVANCGDSRAVLCRGGKAVDLSEDHKPELPQEEERIRNAGGHVSLNGACHRVDGWGLNLSRALGDFHYKSRLDLPRTKQKVIAVPEIQTLELVDEDEFVILGCDGIFELNTSQEAITIVRNALKSGSTLEEAVEELLDKSCSPNLMETRGKGGDNCSAIVVRLR